MSEENTGATPELETVPSTTEQVETPAEQVSETEQVETPVEEKKFSQEEVDKLVQKRLARELRKAERERNAATQKVEVSPASDLKLADFSSPEEYAEALAERKAEKLVEARERRKFESKIEDVHSEREEKARDKYEDFDEVARNPSLYISDLMAATIKNSEMGPDVAYFLGKNPKEAKRIYELPAYLQPYEIAKLEGKVSSLVVEKKTTSAPAPVKPLSSKSSGSAVYDTTDPRSAASMSPDEWIAAEKKRLLRKLGIK